MRFRFNSKQNTIAAYVVIVFSVCLLLVALVFKYSTLMGYLGKVISVLSPVIWGIVIAYIINPFMTFSERHFRKWFCKKKERKKLTRTLSITVSYVLFMGIIAAIIGSIVPEIKNTLTDFMKSLPMYLTNLYNFLNDFIGDFIEKKPEIKQIFDTEFNNMQDIILKYSSKLEPMIENLFEKGGLIYSITDSAWSFLIGFKDCILGIFVSIYLLYSKENFIAQSTKIVHALFSERKTKTILRIASKANYTFTQFLTGKAVDSFIIGILALIGLEFMGLEKYAVLLSIIIGITNMIPFFGPIIGAVPCSVLILLTSPEKTIWFIIFILILQQFDGNILGPKILGNSLGLSPFWIMFAIFIGGGLFGFIGMVAFVPLFAVLYSIAREIIEAKLQKKNLPVSTEYYIHERTTPIIQLTKIKLPKFLQKKKENNKTKYKKSEKE